MLPIYELAAIGAAASWALAGIVSAGPSSRLGAIAFNRSRMAMVFVMLAVWALFSNGFSSIVSDTYWIILLSGFIGIFVGDTALFLTMNRMGPRRTTILFALNAPFSVVLGWLILDEALSFNEVIGILITFVGVLLAIAFGKRPSQLHVWEAIKGPVWIGVLLGLLAALAQSVGSLIIRPVMENGADPVAVSAIRVGIAVLFLQLLIMAPFQSTKPKEKLTLGLSGQIAFSGFLGMALGMTLILFALSGGEVGIMATLSATSPALILPLLWWKTGERPANMAWLGAVLVIIGSWFIFSN